MTCTYCDICKLESVFGEKVKSYDREFDLCRDCYKVFKTLLDARTAYTQSVQAASVKFDEMVKLAK